MKRKGKILASILAIAMLASVATTTVFAAEAPAVEVSKAETIIPTVSDVANMQDSENTRIVISSGDKAQQYSALLEESEIGLRASMKYVDTIFVSLHRGALGIYTCSSIVDLIGNYPVTLTMYLQRRTASSGWSNVTSWKKDLSGSDSYYIEGSLAVSQGYYYRTCIVINVKTSTGSTLETVTSYSGTELYA